MFSLVGFYLQKVGWPVRSKAPLKYLSVEMLCSLNVVNVNSEVVILFFIFLMVGYSANVRTLMPSLGSHHCISHFVFTGVSMLTLI
jgi:hypothetical protein